MWRYQAAAFQLASKEGLEALNLRSLGARSELGITGTAPLHYFGSKVGLLGAIAQHGFDQLTSRLQKTRASSRGGTDAIVSLAVEYARFGLENPHVYRAIHAAQFWHSSATEESIAKAREWIEAGRKARDNAFAEFSHSVREAQDAGVLKRIEPDVAARILTAIVDGYLFQTLEENVDSAESLTGRLAYVARLVEATLAGLAAPARKSP